MPSSIYRLREFRGLGREAIAGVNRVDVDLPCDAQDAVDVEMRGERLLAFSDQVAFVTAKRCTARRSPFD